MAWQNHFGFAGTPSRLAALAREQARGLQHVPSRGIDGKFGSVYLNYKSRVRRWL